MTKFDDFKQSDGMVTAVPRSSRDEAVRFDGSIVQRKEDAEEEANWERLVSQLMDHDLGNALDISDQGEAQIDREQAVSALVESDDQFADTEWQAEAVIDYLDDQNIVEASDNDGVTVLKPFDELSETEYTKMYNNWAAMFDTCIERIDYAHDRVEQAKERFENREAETDRRSSDVNPEERQQELRQKMENLVGDGKPSDLNEADKQEFDHLREQYHFYENMEEAQGPELGPGSDRVKELGRVMEQFDAMRGIMIDHRENFRELALGEAIFPEDLVELSEQYAGFLSSLSGMMDPKEKMEEEDDDEFFDSLGTDEEMEAATEQAEQLSDVETQQTAQ